MTASLILAPGREKSLKRHHPWVFSGAIARVEGKAEAGETVALVSASGEFLAWAAYNPRSQIAARVWSWRREETIDAAFFARRIAASVAARSHPALDPHCCRLVYGESDGLPGVIADRYGDTVVLQLSTAGAEAWREAIADALLALPGVGRVFERSDVDVRALEGLSPRVGPLRGDAPPAVIEIEEGGLRFLVDVRRGHKTGFYLDQRLNRLRVGRLARGRSVLNCFSYTGGFSLHALAQGAVQVTSIDSSAEALAWGRRQAAHNGFPPQAADWVEGDVFRVLRELRNASRRFGLIILDPPKFAPTAAQVEKAARGYKDINLLAFKLLEPGGWLATFSCSGGVSEELFQKIVAGSALDAGVEAAIVERFTQAPDHPVHLAFPEATYLKGLLCRVN